MVSHLLASHKLEIERGEVTEMYLEGVFPKTCNIKLTDLALTVEPRIRIHKQSILELKGRYGQKIFSFQMP